jgi:hypothetical protein
MANLERYRNCGSLVKLEHSGEVSILHEANTQIQMKACTGMRR